MKDKTFKKIIMLLMPYKALIFLSFLCGITTVVASLLIPYLFGLSIDKAAGVNACDFNAINTYIFIIASLIILSAIATYIMSIINNHIVYKTVKDLRNKAFNKLETLPLSYIDSIPTGHIVNNIISDCEQFGDGLLMAFTQFFTSIITIIGVITIMLIINIWISLFVIVLTPLSLLVAKWIAKNSYSSFKEQSNERGNQTAIIDEMIGNQKIVQSYLYEDNALMKFKENNDTLCRISLKATFISSLVNPSTRFINALIYGGVAFIGGLLAFDAKDAITIGELSCMLGYATQYSKPFNEITGVITELQNSLACAAKVFALIERPSEIEVDNDKTIDAPLSIKIDNISFSYDKNKPLIENFNLEVKKGMRVAIVGPTGCGKTTFINLLMRFYELDKGRILFDGIDTNTVKRKNLRKNFGMVLQDTWIPSGTIKDILTMNDDTISTDEIIEACKKTKIYHFIRQLPDGFNTYINENSDQLSLGEKQLLCIARVMLKNPDILILDEATSNIDTRTERLVQDAFFKLMENKTSFIVAHRLSTIKKADIILVMRDGKIIETGNHQELLAKKGFYHTLYNSQFAHSS